MEHVLRYLRAVEKKHKDYFKEQRLKITDCVVITNSGTNLRVDITNTRLPASIQDDIKDVFWI